MTREEAQTRIIGASIGVKCEGAGDDLISHQAHLLTTLRDIELYATSVHTDPEVRAAAQDILRVLGIQAEVAEGQS